MAKTLYDLLEISQAASQEAVTASYQRLHAKLAALLDAGGENATNQMIALREAYRILSNPEQRKRYDQKLALRDSADSSSGERSARPLLKYLFVGVLLAACAAFYSKYQAQQETARLERERIAADEKMAQIALEKEREAKQAALEAEAQRRRDDAAERAAREREIAYGNQVSRNIQMSERQARYEREREERQKAALEQQRQNEAAQQLAREKSYLRQLELENSRYRRAF